MSHLNPIIPEHEPTAAELRDALLVTLAEQSQVYLSEADLLESLALELDPGPHLLTRAAQLRDAAKAVNGNAQRLRSEVGAA